MQARRASNRPGALVSTPVQGQQRTPLRLRQGQRGQHAAALRRYELGFANLQELLDAERAWRSALTGARLDALQRSVQDFQARGGGWNATHQTPHTEG